MYLKVAQVLPSTPTAGSEHDEEQVEKISNLEADKKNIVVIVDKATMKSPRKSAKVCKIL